jgi:hypothetical protein
MSLEVVEAGPGGGGAGEDLVGFLLEFVVVDAAGPGGDLPRPRHRHRTGGGGGVQVGVAGQQPHLADGGLGVLAAEAVFGGEPGGAGGVAVGVVAVGGVEPAQDRVVGGAEQGGDRAELLQGLAAGGSLQVGGGRGVEVGGGRAGGPQCVGDAGETRAGGGQGASRPVWRAHHEPPPSRWAPSASG